MGNVVFVLPARKGTESPASTSTTASLHLATPVCPAWTSQHLSVVTLAVPAHLPQSGTESPACCPARPPALQTCSATLAPPASACQVAESYVVTAPLAWRVMVTTADQAAPRTAMHTNIATRGAANVKKTMRRGWPMLMRNSWRRVKLSLKRGLLRFALQPERGQRTQ